MYNTEVIFGILKSRLIFIILHSNILSLTYTKAGTIGAVSTTCMNNGLGTWPPLKPFDHSMLCLNHKEEQTVQFWKIDQYNKLPTHDR